MSVTSALSTGAKSAQSAPVVLGPTSIGSLLSSNKDIAALAFSCLSPKDVVSTARVSRSWAAILEDNPELWRILTQSLRISMPVAPTISNAFASVYNSSFWRGRCESEWRGIVGPTRGVYALDTFGGLSESAFSALLPKDLQKQPENASGYRERDAQLLEVWDKHAAVWKAVVNLTEPLVNIKLMQWGIDGRLYMACKDKKAKVFSKDEQGNWICEATVEEHPDHIEALRVGPDGRFYTGCKDGKTRVWKEESLGVWRCDTTLAEHTDSIAVLELGSDGRVYTGSCDCTARVWKEESAGVWKCEAIFETPTQRATGILFGSDKKVYLQLIAKNRNRLKGARNETIKIWREEKPGTWKFQGTLENIPSVLNFRLGADGRGYIPFGPTLTICNLSVPEERALKEIALSLDTNLHMIAYDALMKRFMVLPLELRNRVYAAYCQLNPSLKFDVVAQNFHIRSGDVKNEREKRSAAIKRALSLFPDWTPREIALEFARTKPDDHISRAFVMEKFHRLPLALKNKVYGALFHIVAPEKHGPQWGEHAFCHQHDLSSTPAAKCAALLTAIASEKKAAPVATADMKKD